jgi:hypothetical protein
MHPLHNKNHNRDKICKFKGCKRLGSPVRCKECGKLRRFSWCPKHKIRTLEEILMEYNDFLHKRGFIDADYYTEEPYPQDEFMAQQEIKDIEKITL